MAETLPLSTAVNKMVFMTDATGHIDGATGLTLTITASKNGAAFASITPTVTERGNGWYALALTTSHTDTLGDLAVHITASGADPTDLKYVVGPALPDVNAAKIGGQTPTVNPTMADDVADIKAQTDQFVFTTANKVDATATVSLGSNAPAGWINAAAIGSDAITAAKIASDAVAEIQSGLATAASQTTIASYIDTEVSAIKTQTDKLTFTVTNKLDATVAGYAANQDPATLLSFAGWSWNRIVKTLLAPLAGRNVKAADGSTSAFYDVDDPNGSPRITSTNTTTGRTPTVKS